MFTCFLPDFLLPGPLDYILYTDSLVTVNSAHILQVFKCVFATNPCAVNLFLYVCMHVCMCVCVCVQVPVLVSGW